MSFDKIKKVFREIMSEPGPNGTLSWGRVASSVCLLASVVWASHIVFTTHAFPAFDGITGFVVAPYGANKVATAAQAFSNPAPSPTPSLAPTQNPQ
jgi:hypothetical protein